MGGQATALATDAVRRTWAAARDRGSAVQGRDWLGEIRTEAVRDLEVLDDEYMDVLDEHEAECQALRRSFDRRFAEILARRREVLKHGAEDASSSAAASTAKATSGTHALPGFWRKALQNSPEFQEEIEKHDESVLDCLRDISVQWLSEESDESGFRINFVFEKNPYFSNSVLEKVYHTQRKGTFVGRLECVSIDASTISWHSGKNVTTELVTKKPLGHRRHSKHRVEEVARPSFFRSWFRKLGADDDPTQEDRNSQSLEYLIDEDYEQGLALRDSIIPHAVRWYSGEACEDATAGEADDDEASGEHGDRKGAEEAEEEEDPEVDEDGSESSLECRRAG